jgi:hypothetical protein
MATFINAADEYRAAHRNRLMVVTKLRTETPTQFDFCRITSVETLAPSLWITVNFPDGSKKQFRPEGIRLATDHEERFSNRFSAPAV